MPFITIENLFSRKIEVKEPGKSILKHLQENRIDWMHACGGKGRCTTCKAIIINGEENLSARTQAELKYQSQGALKPNERLSCQALVLNDITIRVADLYKLPHMVYSE